MLFSCYPRVRGIKVLPPTSIDMLRNTYNPSTLPLFFQHFAKLREGKNLSLKRKINNPITHKLFWWLSTYHKRKGYTLAGRVRKGNFFYSLERDSHSCRSLGRMGMSRLLLVVKSHGSLSRMKRKGSLLEHRDLLEKDATHVSVESDGS